MSNRKARQIVSNQKQDEANLPISYPWLEDITSYFRVIVNKDGVLVQSTFNGHPINNTYSLPTGYTFTSTSGESRMIKINLAYNGNTKLITINNFMKQQVLMARTSHKNLFTSHFPQ